MLLIYFMLVIMDLHNHIIKKKNVKLKNSLVIGRKKQEEVEEVLELCNKQIRQDIKAESSWKNSLAWDAVSGL